MATIRALALALAACTLAAGNGSAAATVSVTFEHPERYTDAGLYRERGEKAREPALHGIRAHLERLGARHLRPGQSLRIEVLDIDLAGRYEPWRVTTRDVRVLRDITWPRIALRYTLEQDGQPLASAEETLRDMNYLMRNHPGRSSDSLHFEKAMLDDWFRRRIVEGRPPPG